MALGYGGEFSFRGNLSSNPGATMNTEKMLSLGVRFGCGKVFTVRLLQPSLFDDIGQI